MLRVSKGDTTRLLTAHMLPEAVLSKISIYRFFSILKIRKNTTWLLRSIDISVLHWGDMWHRQNTHKHSERSLHHQERREETSAGLQCNFAETFSMLASKINTFPNIKSKLEIQYRDNTTQKTSAAVRVSPPCWNPPTFYYFLCGVVLVKKKKNHFSRWSFAPYSHSGGYGWKHGGRLKSNWTVTFSSNLDETTQVLRRHVMFFFCRSVFTVNIQWK